MEKLDIIHGNITVESKTVFSFGIHTHSYYELTLYEPFPGDVAVNNKSYPIKQLTAILVCPSDFHEIKVQEKTSARYIKIGFTTNVLKGRIPDFSAIMTNIESEDFFVRVFKEILKNPKDKTYAALLVNTLVHIVCEKGESLRHTSTSRGYQLTAEAVKLVNEDFAKSITLEYVAKELSVAPQHLSGAFSKNLGVTFSQYLCDLRLEYAANLVVNSQKSLTEICFESGYNNFSHFSRSFKKKFGKSPREYRKIK